jgi:hypothetical protein
MLGHGRSRFPAHAPIDQHRRPRGGLTASAKAESDRVACLCPSATVQICNPKMSRAARQDVASASNSISPRRKGTVPLRFPNSSQGVSARVATNPRRNALTPRKVIGPKGGITYERSSFFDYATFAKQNRSLRGPYFLLGEVIHNVLNHRGFKWHVNLCTVQFSGQRV